MSLVDRALSYAQDLNFSVFPVHGINPDGSCTCGAADCSNAGKHPATINGLKSATKDENKILNLFASSKPYNLAVCTGAISNIFVLDVDGMEGEASLSALIQQNTPLPKTLTSLTGRGRHIIFRHPGIKIKSRASKLANKLDIRGDGGYIVLPPSLHRSGVYYQWDESSGWDIADAPQWLIDLVKEDNKQPEPTLMSHDPLFTEKWSSDDITDALTYIDPDSSYDDWIAIGMALHSGGYPMAMFNNWSAKGIKYKGQKDIDFHWRSFRPSAGITMGTLIALALTQGWKPQFQQDNILHDIGKQAAANLFSNRSLTAPACDGTPLTIDFDNLPGLIGQTVQWILSNAQKPQPELALLNTITALGAIFGRRYRSPLDTRTNIYTVGLAGTAAGKNHSKKSIKALMVEAQLTEHLGPESIVSGSGLLTSLTKLPSQIMHLDEFGMVLEAIMDKRGASHMKVASKIITELYSNSSEKFYGGQYADGKKDQIIIASPNLCIFGISTLEKYTSSLNREAISSGELNRFIVFKASQDNPVRRRGVNIQPPPDWLIGAWKGLKSGQLQNGMIEPAAILCPWPDLQDRIDDMGDFEDDQIRKNKYQAGALWGRYRENVIKVAMILAISRNQIAPSINPADLDLAEALVRQSVDFMINMVNEHLADSQHEKDCNDIIQVIKRKGGSVSKTDLCRSTQRMDTKQRDAAILSLINQDKIIVDLEQGGKGGGRRGVVYSILKD